MAKTRRGNGEDCYYFRSDRGCWVCDFTLNGRRHSVYGSKGGTKKEVKSKAKIKKKELAEKERREANKKDFITLEKIITDQIEEEFAFNQIKASSYERKQHAAKIIYKSDIAQKPIKEISEDELKEFLISITDYSNSVISKVYLLLKKAYTKAVWYKIISYSPFDKDFGIKKPKSKKQDKKVTALTVDEQKKLIKALKEEQKIVKENPDSRANYITQILIALFTGMRIGEINALTIDDIDFKNHKIKISKTVTRGVNYKKAIGTTKTKNGERTINMSSDVEKILKEYIKNEYPAIKNKAYKKTKYYLLFANKDSGDIIASAQVNDYYKRLCNKYDITKTSPQMHQLRHTFATRCIESGMPAHVLQRFLGHSSVKITIDTYTDVFDSYENDYHEKIESYLGENNLNFFNS